MIINILLCIVAVLFIASSAFVIFVDRKTRLGVIVRDNGEVRTTGRQGIVTTIGREPGCDVKFREHSISRLHTAVRYDPRLNDIAVTEYGAPVGSGRAYNLEKHSLTFSMPIEERPFIFGFVPTVFSLLFIILQGVFAVSLYGTPEVIIPHIVLFLYIVGCFIFRADKTPLAESIMAMLLTFFVEATMYPLKAGDELSYGITMATAGVCVYVLMSVLVKIFTKADIEKIYSLIRLLSVAGIIFFIALNIIFAKETKGAYNWITVGGLTFQPSEAVKLLFAVAMVLPVNKHFDDKKNIVFVMATVLICIAYAFFIKDIGALLQIGIIFVIGVFLQNNKFYYSLIIVLSGILGVKLIMKLSTTAISRVLGWTSGSDNIIESFLGTGVFNDPHNYGYQSVASCVATFRNGGLFGNTASDMLKDIEAVNSDLVTAFIGQRHGYVFLFIIIALYILLAVTVLFTLRQKNKYQQTISCIAIGLVTVAVIMNIGGTFGIIPLTGVVCPALSLGTSAAVSYGALMGAISSTSLSRGYMKKIKGKVS